MQLSLLPATLLALLPLASATPGYSYGGSDASSSSSSSGSGSGTSSPAAVQSGTPSSSGVTVITVGKTQFKMEPNDVTVPAGGIIEFRFYAGAHSVAQSAFDSPCTPLNATADGGFFSGAQAVQSGEGPNVFRVVSTGSPMWYYCATAKHCQNGMVGVINKPANNAQRTIQAYTAAAANAAQNIAPSSQKGGVLVAAGSPVTAGTGSGNVQPSRAPGAASGVVRDFRMVGAAVFVAALGAFAL